MKINLAENILRFGVKNLNKSDINRVKMLAEAAANETTPKDTRPGLPGLVSTKDFNLGLLDTIFGQGTAQAWKDKWPTIKEGDKNIIIKTPAGILVGESPERGGSTSSVSVSVKSLIRIAPVTITVPKDKVITAEDAIANNLTKGAAADVILNVFTCYDFGMTGGGFNFTQMTSGAVNSQEQSYLDTVNMQGLKPIAAATALQGTYEPKLTWGNAIKNQNVSFYPSDKYPPSTEANANVCKKLFREWLASNTFYGYETNERMLAVLGSPEFASYASSIKIKPGKWESNQAIALGGAWSTLYTAIGSKTDTPIAAARAVPTVPAKKR